MSVITFPKSVHGASTIFMRFGEGNIIGFPAHPFQTSSAEADVHAREETFRAGGEMFSGDYFEEEPLSGIFAEEVERLVEQDIIQ